MSAKFSFLLLILSFSFTLGEHHRYHHHQHQRRRRVRSHNNNNNNDDKVMVLDLSHTLSPSMPVLDGAAPLEMIEERRDEGNGARSSFYEFCMDERLGTHLNSPNMYLHRNESLTTDSIPLEMLVNVPAVTIDIPAEKPDGTPNSAMLTSNDISRFEDKHGRIPQGAFVLLRSGWSKYFSTAEDKFRGIFHGESKQVFPGFSGECVRWLMDQRDIAGLGTESIDIELGWKTRHRVKHLLATQNKLSIVQLNDLDSLPNSGFTLTVAPLKLHGGSGGTARVFAVVNKAVERRLTRKRSQQRLQQQQTSTSTSKPTTEDSLWKDFESDSPPVPPIRINFNERSARSAGGNNHTKANLLCTFVIRRSDNNSNI